MKALFMIIRGHLAICAVPNPCGHSNHTPVTLDDNMLSCPVSVMLCLAFPPLSFLEHAPFLRTLLCPTASNEHVVGIHIVTPTSLLSFPLGYPFQQMVKFWQEPLWDIYGGSLGGKSFQSDPQVWWISRTREQGLLAPRVLAREPNVSL